MRVQTKRETYSIQSVLVLHPYASWKPLCQHNTHILFSSHSSQHQWGLPVIVLADEIIIVPLLDQILLQNHMNISQQQTIPHTFSSALINRK